MATAKKPSAILVKAPLIAALAVASAMLMCACPAREAAPGQDAATTGTLLAAGSESNGVSLWYEFVVSEIGFMLDENGELPQSLDDWKHKAEEEGCATWIFDASSPRYMHRGFQRALHIDQHLKADIEVYFDNAAENWLQLVIHTDEYFATEHQKFSMSYLEWLAESVGTELVYKSLEEIPDPEDPERNVKFSPAAYTFTAREESLLYVALKEKMTGMGLYVGIPRFVVIGVLNLPALNSRSITSLKEENEFAEEFAVLPDVPENQPPPDSPRLPAPPPLPAPQAVFLAEPFSLVTTTEEHFPCDYTKWIETLERGEAHRWECRELNWQSISTIKGRKITVNYIGRITDIDIRFRDRSSGWSSIAYERVAHRWDELVFQPAFWEKMLERYPGEMHTQDLYESRTLFGPVEIENVGLEHKLWLCDGDLACSAALRDYSPDLIWGLRGIRNPEISVVVYALDRIGPLTKENIKDAGMLQTLRKLAALPANE